MAAPASVVNNTVNNTVTLHGSQNRLSWGNVSHSNADASPKSFAEFDAIVTDGSPSLPDTVVVSPCLFCAMFAAEWNVVANLLLWEY